MHEDCTGDAATTGRVKAVLNGNVVIDNNVIDFDVFIGGHVHCHFKIEDVAGVVLDDTQNARVGCDSFNALENFVGSRRSEDSTGHRAIEHSFADEATVSRFMTGAAAADERDFVCGFLRCTDDNIAAVKLFEFVRRGFD